ncbi:MAG: response regulator, partial [Betaproteobacteria bacterium]|nr:response regulator [Betaproteobacteria bacterium]
MDIESENKYDAKFIKLVEGYSALIIEDSGTARTVLAAALREIGVGRVSTSSMPGEGLRKLTANKFDIVLCDYHFGPDKQTGQDLLETIRTKRLLPMTSIFFMITGEASYERVAEVVETAPDDYLLKPFTAALLYDRMMQIIRRKEAFRAIHEAIDAEKYQRALELAEELFHSRSMYRINAARLAGEICMKLNRFEKARFFYEAVLRTKAVPWARLGLAHVEHEGGNTKVARRTLESLVSDHSNYVDAYDFLGRIMVDDGDLNDALEIFKRAVKVTPGSVPRLQKMGSLAFLMGQTDAAEVALEKAVRLGIGSQQLDFQTIIQLAMLKLDKNDARAISKLREPVAAALNMIPESFRLLRMLEMLDC